MASRNGSSALQTTAVMSMLFCLSFMFLVESLAQGHDAGL